MEILNIGPLELGLVVLIMFFLLGPKEMIRLARRAGDAIRRVQYMPLWKEIRSAMREIDELPTRLAREAGYEETMADIRKQMQMPRPAGPPPIGRHKRTRDRSASNVTAAAAPADSDSSSAGSAQAQTQTDSDS